MTGWRNFAPGLAALLLAACGNDKPTGEVGFVLPSPLNEVSGLAVAGPDSVFAHNDEHAIVYEIDVDNGHIRRAFALGDPTIEGDFEGIATAGGTVFLVTSDGLIYSAEPGENAKRVPYKVYDSGIGARCEAEGLSQAPQLGYLLVLCKRLRSDEDVARIEIYQWRIGAGRADLRPWLSRPLDGIVDEKDQAEFRPSGLDWDPVNGRLMVVSGRNRVVLEFDGKGEFLDRRYLDHTRHPKTEGVALLPDGRLVLADEGSTTRKGKMAVYYPPSEE